MYKKLSLLLLSLFSIPAFAGDPQDTEPTQLDLARQAGEKAGIDNLDPLTSNGQIPSIHDFRQGYKTARITCGVFPTLDVKIACVDGLDGYTLEKVASVKFITQDQSTEIQADTSSENWATFYDCLSDDQWMRMLQLRVMPDPEPVEAPVIIPQPIFIGSPYSPRIGIFPVVVFVGRRGFGSTYGECHGHVCGG